MSNPVRRPPWLHTLRPSTLTLTKLRTITTALPHTVGAHHNQSAATRSQTPYFCSGAQAIQARITRLPECSKPPVIKSAGQDAEPFGEVSNSSRASRYCRPNTCGGSSARTRKQSSAGRSGSSSEDQGRLEQRWTRKVKAGMDIRLVRFGLFGTRGRYAAAALAHHACGSISWQEKGRRCSITGQRSLTRQYLRSRCAMGTRAGVFQSRQYRTSDSPRSTSFEERSRSFGRQVRYSSCRFVKRFLLTDCF